MSAKTIEEVLTDATPKAVTVFEVIRDVEELGGGKKLAVSHSVEPPECTVAPRASHEFHDIDGLRSYVVAYGKGTTVILGDISSYEAKVSLDEHDGDGGFSVLMYKPVFHPLFKTWLDIVGKDFPILDFAKFVMTNRRSVKDGRNMALLFQQIRMSKKIEIAVWKGKKAINGVMVTTEINGGKTEVFEELPETLTIIAPVFLKSGVSEIELDLLIFERQEQVFVNVSAGNIDSIKADQFMSDLHWLDGELNESIVSYGKINYTEKKFIKN